jgi:hypothetical protein
MSSTSETESPYTFPSYDLPEPAPGSSDLEICRIEQHNELYFLSQMLLGPSDLIALNPSEALDRATECQWTDDTLPDIIPQHAFEIKCSTYHDATVKLILKPQIAVRLHLGKLYPQESPLIGVRPLAGMSKEDCKCVAEELTKFAAIRVGQVVVLDMVLEIKSVLERLVEGKSEKVSLFAQMMSAQEKRAQEEERVAEFERKKTEEILQKDAALRIITPVQEDNLRAAWLAARTQQQQVLDEQPQQQGII